MLHYIDGELMMVGVLDYTTSCLSSVYLYYDPKYEALSPGTLAAVREIEHVRKLMTTGHFPESF
jgi:arginine-tRNA-protein transferase